MKNFGQLVGSYSDFDSSPYLQKIEVIKDENGNFKNDVKINVFNKEFSNDGLSYSFNSTESYYLQFSISALEEDDQTISLRLRSTKQSGSDTEVITQLLQTYNIPGYLKEEEQKKYIFEIIFTPNGTYPILCWELNRTSKDFTEGQRNTDINIEKFARIKNVINPNSSNSSFINTNVPLTKIGIQGPPSLLMCINGEQIRLGKSGVYELNNEIDITFISFIPTRESDYFIMDYEY